MATSIPASGHAASHSDGVDHDLKLRRGMLFYVLTDVLFVIFLLATYIWLRAYRAPGWFPAGHKNAGRADRLYPDRPVCPQRDLLSSLGSWACAQGANPP